jgi:hypothetical protein
MSFVHLLLPVRVLFRLVGVENSIGKPWLLYVLYTTEANWNFEHDTKHFAVRHGSRKFGFVHFAAAHQPAA